MQDPANINKLLQQLDNLQWKQEALRLEMEELKKQLISFSSPDIHSEQAAAQAKPPTPTADRNPEANQQKPEPVTPAPPVYRPAAKLSDQPVRSWKEEKAIADGQPAESVAATENTTAEIQASLEKFIGENLINKIGIAITVIGVAIGAKYAIDNELISPLTRIILGYLAGMGLMGFAIYLKQKYHDFSAVLLSGAMAIMYFITFAAYSFYGLFPQTVAFILMLLFTGFTVVAALQYNRQVIAHIGLVGAYAVPFLLSDGSGRVAILFSYMAIINTGILIIAFKRYWKPLYYVSFGLSWLIFLAWYGAKFEHNQHFALAFGFATLFFILFYLTQLAYKLVRKELFGQADVLLLLINSFIFYGIGYALLDGQPAAREYLGLFTLLNALVHFGVCSMVYQKKLADKNLFYLLAGLVLVFVTIAVPVQLDGNWVTLLWAGEAALLFWIGRSRGVSLYEKLAFPLILLAFISLAHDWSDYYTFSDYNAVDSQYRPLLNIYFLTSLLFLAAFGFMVWLSRRTPSSLGTHHSLAAIMEYVIGALLLLVLYFSFQLEISTYGQMLYESSAIEIPEEEYSYRIFNNSLLDYKNIWILNYSLLFLSLLAFVNIYKLRHTALAWVTLGFSALALIIFLTNGLSLLNNLRIAWLLPQHAEYFTQGIGNLLIRYLSFALLGGLLVACYRLIKQDFLQVNIRLAFDFALGGTLLWIASNELIHWMHLAGSSQSNKLGLSILWGIYALLVIVLGIRQNKKHLRMGAFLLFGVTLAKLFLYDLSHLDTIAKTIVLVSLGILLLIISFLYNKYKHLISDASHK